MITLADLPCDIWLIIIDFLDNPSCQTQKDLTLLKQRPLKLLALVNCKLASIVHPRLSTDFSVTCPYNFAVTFLASSKTRSTEFTDRVSRLDTNAKQDISGSKKLLAGYEVFFNFPGKHTRLRTLRDTMMPCFELISRLCHAKAALQIASVKHLTIDCEGLPLLKLCASVTKLNIMCNERDGFCYVTASAKELSQIIRSINVKVLSCNCHVNIVHGWPEDLKTWTRLFPKVQSPKAPVNWPQLAVPHRHCILVTESSHWSLFPGVQNVMEWHAVNSVMIHHVSKVSINEYGDYDCTKVEKRYFSIHLAGRRGVIIEGIDSNEAYWRLGPEGIGSLEYVYGHTTTSPYPPH